MKVHLLFFVLGAIHIGVGSQVLNYVKAHTRIGTGLRKNLSSEFRFLLKITWPISAPFYMWRWREKRKTKRLPNTPENRAYHRHENNAL